MIAKEIRVWSNLHHQNVLMFLGYALEGGDYPLLVSEWMENGTVQTYVQRNKLSIKELLPIVSISATFFKSSTNLNSYWGL